jgi:hypothetical protein
MISLEEYAASFDDDADIKHIKREYKINILSKGGNK